MQMFFVRLKTQQEKTVQVSITTTAHVSCVYVVHRS